MKLDLKTVVTENPVLAILRGIPTETVLDYAGAILDGGIRFF